MELKKKPAYRIRDWDLYFENSESRKLKSTSIRFVLIPNKHDGKGFARIAANKNAVKIFAAWNLIVQIASKLPERGLLVDDEGPLTTEDMSFKTRFPQEIFDLALDFLSSSSIGWLEKIECPEFITTSGRASRQIPTNPEMSQEIPSCLDGREGKGREGNDILSDKSDSVVIPYEGVIVQYHENCISFPKVKKLTKSRRLMIKARWSEYPDIKDFIQMFHWAERSDFLTGRDGKWPNCTIDNLLTSKIFTKCFEGGYANSENYKPDMTLYQINKELERIDPEISELEYHRDNYTSGLDDKKRQKLKDLKAERENLNELKCKLMDKKE